MTKRFLFLFPLLFLFSCGKDSQDLCTHFEGWEMTMPYRVTIGKKLSRKEKKEVFKTLTEVFQTVDQTFNNWNPNSEISKVNASLENIPIYLSSELSYLLSFCEQIVSLSSGRFDPAIAPLIQTWQKALKEKRVPDAPELEAASEASGWRHLALKNNILTKDHPKASIDFCSVSKGLTVDWIVERLHELGYENLFVEWAGEIRASGLHPEGKPWVVKIDPNLKMEGKAIAPIYLKNGAIATSGDGGQKEWILPASASFDGEIHRFFHIFDPLTELPLEKTLYSVASVSVIAPTCVLADALATAAMVFPNKKEVEKWAEEVTTLYPDVSFWILCYDPNRAPKGKK